MFLNRTSECCSQQRVAGGQYHLEGNGRGRGSRRRAQLREDEEKVINDSDNDSCRAGLRPIFDEFNAIAEAGLKEGEEEENEDEDEDEDEDEEEKDAFLSTRSAAALSTPGSPMAC
jgi:hypothetical protein